MHPLQTHQGHMEKGNYKTKVTQVCGPSAKLQRRALVTYNRVSHSSHHWGCVGAFHSPSQWCYIGKPLGNGMPPTLRQMEVIVTWRQVIKEKGKATPQEMRGNTQPPSHYMYMYIHLSIRLGSPQRK